jgi:hypothetical protein
MICIFPILLLAALLAACATKTTVLGSPQANDGKFERINPGKLTISFTRYLDTYVALNYTFATRLNTTPQDGYQAMLVRSDFGAAYVLIKNGLYADELSRLRKGDMIQVYGHVTASRLPTDTLPKITIIIDQ